MFGVIAKGSHGLEARAFRLESRGSSFWVGGAGVDLSRLLRWNFSNFTGALGIPADASGAYRPSPQAKAEVVPAPPLKG